MPKGYASSGPPKRPPRSRVRKANEPCSVCLGKDICNKHSINNHNCRSQIKEASPRKCLRYRWLAISEIIFYLLITTLLITISIRPSISDPNYNTNFMNPQQFSIRKSDHFTIGELCPTKSQFPPWRRTEGAVIMSTTEIDSNCTFILKTKSVRQRFLVRFEDLKLDCNDHLKLFDGDMNYGQPSIKDYSCRDNIANVELIQTTSAFLTVSYTSDKRSKQGDGFRFVATAFHPIDDNRWDRCPSDHSLCRSELCIPKSLFCDGVNHCVDNSDEVNCAYGQTKNNWFSEGDLNLSNALGLLVVLVLIISACVIIFISAVHCKRDNHYAQYEHHLQRAIGVPLQTSSSLMFTNAQPQYQYFQPANFSPYVTPQHHAIATTTLPAGYSTLPLNLIRQQQPQQQAPPIIAKANNINPEYLMMTGLPANPNSVVPMTGAPTMQTNLFIPNSQSILTSPGATRNLTQPKTQERR